MHFSLQVLWQSGWPLLERRGVVLHLGALNESLLRPGDLYLCIRAEPSVQLCAAWSSTSTDGSSSVVVYRALDTTASLSPLALDMLAEELPTLLQNLLVSVEHAICRVPIDELTTFAGPGATGITDKTTSNASSSASLLPKPVLSPRCSIKRRDVITKSNYRRLGATTPPQKNDSGNQQQAQALDPTSMPLFCLGGSFPHIDSDEESAEDSQQSHNDTGERCRAVMAF